VRVLLALALVSLPVAGCGGKSSAAQDLAAAMEAGDPNVRVEPPLRAVRVASCEQRGSIASSDGTTSVFDCHIVTRTGERWLTCGDARASNAGFDGFLCIEGNAPP